MRGPIAAAFVLLAAGLSLRAAPEPQPLKLVRAALSQYEDGPPVAGSFAFAPGDSVFFTCAITGYKPTPGDEAKVALAWQIRVLDPKGVELVEPASGKIDATLAPEDKDWAPRLRHTIIVPPLIFAGRYRIQAAVEDKISGQKASLEVPVEVRGHDVQPSETLVVRNLRFFRGESQDALVQPIYRRGDTLAVRFDITGYKFTEGNHLHVEYGIAVEDGEGKTLYAEPKAAVEDDSSFYPKQYLPGSLTLTLNEKVRPASYVLVISVRDEAGQQTWETRQPFKVE